MAVVYCCDFWLSFTTVIFGCCVVYTSIYYSWVFVFLSDSDGVCFVPAFSGLQVTPTFCYLYPQRFTTQSIFMHPTLYNIIIMR